MHRQKEVSDDQLHMQRRKRMKALYYFPSHGNHGLLGPPGHQVLLVLVENKVTPHQVSLVLLVVLILQVQYQDYLYYSGPNMCRGPDGWREAQLVSPGRLSRRNCTRSRCPISFKKTSLPALTSSNTLTPPTWKFWSR